VYKYCSFSGELKITACNGTHRVLFSLGFKDRRKYSLHHRFLLFSNNDALIFAFLSKVQRLLDPTVTVEFNPAGFLNELAVKQEIPAPTSWPDEFRELFQNTPSYKKFWDQHVEEMTLTSPSNGTELVWKCKLDHKTPDLWYKHHRVANFKAHIKKFHQLAFQKLEEDDVGVDRDPSTNTPSNDDPESNGE
jgi:hypothetical protein